MRKICFALALAGSVALVLATSAAATMQGHEVTLTDPYAACPLTPDVFGGVNYPDTEIEPWVQRNLANPDNLIGAFQQDRWSDGGARGLVAGWSFNDGYKWGETPLPFSKCAAPFYGGAVLPYDRASDPWTAVGPDGRAYTVSISFDANDNNNAVGAATSVDGGVTWQNQQPIITDLDADPQFPFNDKESVTADPVHPGFAYVVWDRLVLIACGPDVKPRRPVEYGPREADPQDEPICFEGPTWFSRTTDGGVTWSKPVPIVPTLPDEQTISNQIVVDPKTDRLYNFYLYFPNREPFTPEIRMVFSNDQGVTWSDQQFVNTNETVGIHDPDNPDQFAQTGDIIPEPAVDRNTGQLYVVWQDGRYNNFGEDDTLISTSVGAGLTGTWTVPQKVNLESDRAGFTPAINVNDLSQVGVDYYSLRHPDLGPDVWPTERYLRISNGPAVVSTPTSGGQPVAQFSFLQPTHVTGPFNMYMAPFAGGWFVGDYESLTIDRDGRSFHTYYSQTNCDTTNCPSVGVPAPATGTLTTTSSPPDPVDIYTNSYFKNGGGP